MAELGELAQLRPVFSGVPEDILVNIFYRIDEDPRDLARLSCVCARFFNVIRTICWKARCLRTRPALVADLLQRPGVHADRCVELPGGWASLQKVLICCPGLWHAGVLLENWDFGLDRELGWFDVGGVIGYQKSELEGDVPRQACGLLEFGSEGNEEGKREVDIDCEALDEEVRCLSSISNFTDSDSFREAKAVNVVGGKRSSERVDLEENKISNVGLKSQTTRGNGRKRERLHKASKRQIKHYHEHCHVASGSWNLSREEGNKILANRFRADSLYICDWPGCVHPGRKRNYKLFRGVFKNFKTSHVWRNLKDMKAKAVSVGCAFCSCKSTWDMVNAFCLKRSIEYHDDGEPVIRAYVCENGHVAGAWTDRPTNATDRAINVTDRSINCMYM